LFKIDYASTRIFTASDRVDRRGRSRS